MTLKTRFSIVPP